ncbi:MAG: CpsD/CapB family tyrosine-protein kinase, partial [Acidobacteria bacterium]|nr:CpsD/CapB family tyrosine-protein kinase [Acidobacteriota bacterium]
RVAPRSASAEAFRFAAAALDARMNADPLDHGLVLGVTSSSISEGKTVVAVNTAIAAAREGKRVLLIDADFGNQATTAILLPDSPPESGITEVVEGGTAMRDAVVTIEGDGESGLHLLSRGWRETTAPEFFRLPATKAFLKRVSEHYDLVVVDAPPLLQVAYASTIISITDKVLVVVPHRSSVTNLTELEDRLELIGSPLFGYIYNMAPLNLGMTLTEGSMKDVLGTDDTEPARS